MLRGLCNVSFYADDLLAAKEWYTAVLGVEPYFQRPVDGPPGYLEYRVGDYQHEFGLIDRRYAPPGPTEPAGAVVYWHVDDVSATVDKLLSMGAKEHEPITERGPGFVTASIVDPFGNVLGVMYNQHYLDVLATFGVSEPEQG